MPLSMLTALGSTEFPGREIYNGRTAMKYLFERAALGKLSLKNRLIRSATWEGLADETGHIPEQLYQVYERLAKGGVGAIITGFTSVADDDHYFGGIMRISNDELVREHRRLVNICHAENTPVMVQLALGEYNSPQSRNMDIDDMTADDIEKVIRLFVAAAQRAAAAGYDGVQIHAAHNFFLSRFISPAYNHRQDEYGGNVIARGKILLDILQGIKTVSPQLHVTVKINCSDFIADGLTPQESMLICQMLARKGIDSIEVSGNGTSVAGIRAGVNEAYFKEFALALADMVSVPIILVGGHRSIEGMEQVLNAGNIAFLSLSRPLVREPALPKRWQDGDRSPAKCVSCNMCYQTPGHACIFVLRNGSFQK